MKLNEQLLKFIFQDSQVDEDVAASLVEAERLEKVTTQKAPLIKVLKNLGVEVDDTEVDEEGCRLVVKDAATYHKTLAALGTVEAMDALAEAGWVAGISGDVSDTTELPEYTIHFLCLTVAEPSKLDKALDVEKLNKAVKAGSDSEPVEEAAEDLLRNCDTCCPTWEVVAGNLGCVYSGDDEEEARRVYTEYCSQSKGGCGRVGDECVTLFNAGEPCDEFSPDESEIGKRERLHAHNKVAEALEDDNFDADADAEHQADDLKSRREAANEITGWEASDTTDAKHLGTIEFKTGHGDDGAGEWISFEVLELPDRFVFGGATNTGFIESGFIRKEEGESVDETLQELYADLLSYYNDGPQSITRIVHNDRM